MKRIITNYRYWVLALLSSAFFIGLFAVPQDGMGFLAHAASLIGTKLAAFAASCLCAALYKHWRGKGEIPELEDLIGREG